MGCDVMRQFFLDENGNGKEKEKEEGRERLEIGDWRLGIGECIQVSLITNESRERIMNG